MTRATLRGVAAMLVPSTPRATCCRAVATGGRRSDVADLTCEDLVELVTDYLDGELDEDVAAKFEQHLAICPGCRTYVDQMAQTASLLGEIPADTLSREMQTSLLDAFRGFHH
jgi:hypothetical protein